MYLYLPFCSWHTKNRSKSFDFIHIIWGEEMMSGLSGVPRCVFLKALPHLFLKPRAVSPPVAGEAERRASALRLSRGEHLQGTANGCAERAQQGSEPRSGCLAPGRASLSY